MYELNLLDSGVLDSLNFQNLIFSLLNAERKIKLCHSSTYLLCFGTLGFIVYGVKVKREHQMMHETLLVKSHIFANVKL